MNSNYIIIFLIFTISSTSTRVCCQSDIFTVDESGAISFALTDNKQAFTDAWKKACSTNGGAISIPTGTNYLLSNVEFVGPCTGQTKFILDGSITATDVHSPNIDYWIIFRNVNGLTISGKGTLDGNGVSFWKQKHDDIAITSLKVVSSKNVVIQDIRSTNSKKFHMNVNGCQNVSINNVHIKAPNLSPNTDGIHVGDSDSVGISNSDISTGDDCISLGDGTSNINITGITCGPGHGISIGSLGKYPNENDVRSITVTNCTLTNTTNGVRIKSWAPSPVSSVSLITFQGIIINNIKNPIIIDQYYCPNSKCKGSGESSVAIKGVKFIDIHGSSGTAVGVNIACSKKNPCQDIELSGVKLTYNGKPTTAACSSANIRFNGPNQVPSNCIQIQNFM